MYVYTWSGTAVSPLEVRVREGGREGREGEREKDRQRERERERERERGIMSAEHQMPYVLKLTPNISF